MNSIELSKKVRIDVLNMIHNSHASHIASAFSVIDILSVLYCNIANVNNNNFNDEMRDRIILSKGHAGSALYAILAELNFFNIQTLNTYYQNGSLLSGHCSHVNVNGVEISTGSLGHGISIACGIALALKLKKINSKVYCIVGDGECDEGSIWETIAFAVQQKLDNLIIIVDCNNMQAMGNCEDIISIKNIDKKFLAFGCNVIKINDGNNHNQIIKGFKSIISNYVNVLIAYTIKGKGVSYMENNLLWHYRDPQDTFYKIALQELSK